MGCRLTTRSRNQKAESWLYGKRWMATRVLVPTTETRVDGSDLRFACRGATTRGASSGVPEQRLVDAFSFFFCFFLVCIEVTCEGSKGEEFFFFDMQRRRICFAAKDNSGTSTPPMVFRFVSRWIRHITSGPAPLCDEMTR